MAEILYDTEEISTVGNIKFTYSLKKSMVVSFMIYDAFLRINISACTLESQSLQYPYDSQLLTSSVAS